MIYMWVALGGGLGTLARFTLSLAAANQFGEFFPWGTLIINVTGSFLIGFFVTLTDPGGPVLLSPDVRSFVAIGFCGGYTTFSSFSLQTLRLVQAGQWASAGINVAASNIGCLVAVWLGHACAVALRK